MLKNAVKTHYPIGGVMRRYARPAALLLAIIASTVVALSPATPVAADTRDIDIVGNVWLREGPSTGHAKLQVILQGSKPDYICYTRGQNVRGKDVWFRVRYGGHEGYYSSIWDTASTDPENNGVHACGTGAEINQTPVVTPDTFYAVGYNRDAAVSWANEHVTDGQPRWWPGCTWFVSRALWAGGYYETDAWTSKGESGRLRKTPGTPTATAAPDLVNYLVNTGRARVVELDSKRFYENKVPEAKRGDIIAYDWDNDGGINHLALVVNIADGQYPEVAEWGTTNLPWDNRVDYRMRGWTWSMNDNDWLQVHNRNITAKLLVMQ